jgi:hypothetical protein
MDLITACMNADVDEVQRLLALEGEDRVDVHVGRHQQRTTELLLVPDDDWYIDVYDTREGAFLTACYGGKLEVVKLLLALGGDRHIDVHVLDEAPFRLACASGNADVVQLLLSLDGDRYVNVHARNDDAFANACRCGRMAVVLLLLELDGERAMPLPVIRHGAECMCRTEIARRRRVNAREPLWRACAAVALGACASACDAGDSAGARYVRAVLFDPHGRMTALGGREGARLSLASTHLGSVLRFL